MSVDYTAGLAYGWAFSGQQYADFNKATDNKYEDMFIVLDPYYGDSCQQKAIFGMWIVSNPNIGTAKPIIHPGTIISSFDMSEYIAAIEEAGYDLTVIPTPHYFIVNRVS